MPVLSYCKELPFRTCLYYSFKTLDFTLNTVAVIHFINDMKVWQVTALTSLIKHGVRFILLYQRLHLLRLQGRVQDLIQPRVSLLVVDEVSHLIYCEVWPALGTTTKIE